MRHFIHSILTLLILTVSALNASAERPAVGFVLSGGGAKGIAHAGVIKALEENGIHADCVTGTSMGAIVGSLYSCGYSADEMMQLFGSKEFLEWSRGVIAPREINAIYQPVANPVWAKINFKLKKGFQLNTNSFPGSLISPLPMNYEFVRLYAPYSQQCGDNFDHLMVPFRCVTSDVYDKRKIVLGSGDLGEAVRASMSFPMVFKPIEIDSVLVFDGGIYDNFPTDVMEKDFDPEFIIGISVSGPNAKPKQDNMYSQFVDMVMQKSDYSVDPKRGIKIQVPVLNFAVLEFNKAQEIYEIGYRTGLQYVDSIKKRLPKRARNRSIEKMRSDWKAATPTPQIRHVTSTSPSGATDFFSVPCTIDSMKNMYYSAISTGRYSDMFMRLSGDTLHLYPSARDKFGVGLGGWLTTSAQSRLFLDFGYSDFLKKGDLFCSNLQAWLGQSYMAARLVGRTYLPVHRGAYVELEGVWNRTKLYDHEQHFWEWDEMAHGRSMEIFMRASFGMALNRSTIGRVSVGYGLMHNRVTAPDASPVSRYYHPWTLDLNVSRKTLDNEQYPSAGNAFEANLQGSRSRTDTHDWHNRLTLNAYYKHYFTPASLFSIGVSGYGGFGLQTRRDSYYANLLLLHPFEPLPSVRNYLNAGLRADNYLALGLSPVFKPVQNLQVRLDAFLYMPVRDYVATGADGSGRVANSKWFPRREFIGEASVVYNLPFASVALYGNYLSTPRHNWNIGLNFGFLMDAPHLLAH